MAKTADEKGRKVPPPSAGGTHLHRGNAEVHDIEATPPNHPFANHIAPAGRLESHYSAHQEPPTSRRTWMIRPLPTYIERLSANRWFVQSRAQGFVPTRARLDISGRALGDARGIEEVPRCVAPEQPMSPGSPGSPIVRRRQLVRFRAAEFAAVLCVAGNCAEPGCGWDVAEELHVKARW